MWKLPMTSLLGPGLATIVIAIVTLGLPGLVAAAVVASAGMLQLWTLENQR